MQTGSIFADRYVSSLWCDVRIAALAGTASPVRARGRWEATKYKLTPARILRAILVFILRRFYAQLPRKLPRNDRLASWLHSGFSVEDDKEFGRIH